ncbi:MAG: glycogen/starch synthase [Prevotella sp.]|nr:glycogen/starch synthase [Prevotella sp.]
MNKKKLLPDFIFESSWEVCHKVGGIYTVLSTRAKTLQEKLPDRIVFIGPDFAGNQENPYFSEETTPLDGWKPTAEAEGLRVRVGRWTVPGRPIAVLVDFTPFYAQKNEVYGWLWEHFGVDSLHAYGDYDEASMFSLAAAKVVESIYKHLGSSGVQEFRSSTPNIQHPTPNVIYHANEWMCGLGALYIRHHLPQIATVFTTHATTVGRSIAGNNKPLYDYLFAYNGDQMSHELNVESKHSVEKQTAHFVDCFTTVSQITAHECEELLDKPVDVVLPNGFEDDFVPKGQAFTRKRKAARKRLLEVAKAQTGKDFDDDALIVSTSGRYEFRNKGIDVFIEAMNRLRFDERLQKNVVAFIEVPGSLSDDRVSGMMNWLGMHNAPDDKVHVVVVPDYLTGSDGLLNMSYYDVVLGNDLCIYPSYYEPWGYTPLEAVAFRVPCITTDLAGFGLWAREVARNEEQGAKSEILSGVKVVHRTDYNYSEVADAIKETVAEFSSLTADEVALARKNAEKLSKKALWKQFIKYYFEAYDVALQRAAQRNTTII